MGVRALFAYLFITSVLWTVCPCFHADDKQIHAYLRVISEHAGIRKTRTFMIIYEHSV